MDSTDPLAGSIPNLRGIPITTLPNRELQKACPYPLPLVAEAEGADGSRRGGAWWRAGLRGLSGLRTGLRAGL